MALEPGDDRSGRRLPTFDDRLVGIDSVHIGAPHALRMDRPRRNSELQMRGSGDERHFARLGHTEPDHANEGIGAALRHRNAGLKAEMRGRIFREDIDHVTRPDDP